MPATAGRSMKRFWSRWGLTPSTGCSAGKTISCKRSGRTLPRWFFRVMPSRRRSWMEHLSKLQKELLQKVNQKDDYDALADEILRLRD